jgi:hypothetical protein
MLTTASLLHFIQEIVRGPVIFEVAEGHADGRILTTMLLDEEVGRQSVGCNV